MITPPFLSGQLLLSMPGIGDPRFERKVIAMCLHDDEGALAITRARDAAEALPSDGWLAADKAARPGAA